MTNMMNLKLYTKALIIFSAILILTPVINSQSRVIEEKSFTVNPGELLSVKAEGADVSVFGYDGNEAVIKIYGNRKAEDKMDFEIEYSGGEIYVSAEKRGGFFSGWFSSLNCRIEIKVPSKFNAKVKTSGGDIILDDLIGEVELKTSGGGISSKGTEGEFLASTSGGDINVEDQLGNTKLSTSGGDVKARRIKGDTDASTSGGDIELDIDQGRVEASTSGGDIVVDYKGTNMGIDLRTSGGDVVLRVDEEIKGDFYLRASGGRVYCDLDATRVYKDSKRTFEAEINGGGEKVYCKTSGGDVEVK